VFIKSIKYFNLVEVAVSIGILAIGMTAIMSLFPVGFDRSKDAIGENYCAEAADSLFSYIARAANRTGGWDSIILTLPSSKADIPDTGMQGNKFFFGSASEGDIYYEASGVDNLGTPLDASKGVYGIKVMTGDVIDFTGEALLWRTNLPEIKISGQTKNISSDIATGVNLEISWQVEKPYLKRKKNYYYFELNNSNY